MLPGYVLNLNSISREVLVVSKEVCNDSKAGDYSSSQQRSGTYLLKVTWQLGAWLPRSFLSYLPTSWYLGRYVRSTGRSIQAPTLQYRLSAYLEKYMYKRALNVSCNIEVYGSVLGDTS